LISHPEKRQRNYCIRSGTAWIGQGKQTANPGAWIDLIQSLIEPCDHATYAERFREGGKKLGVLVRSVQRLFKKYQEERLAALTSTPRGDKGKHINPLSSVWDKFRIYALTEA
jgi:hypothetical protein